MRLIRLGAGFWTVLAVGDERGGCAVLDLLEAHGAPGERLLADLMETIPTRGPQHNRESSRPLRDKILELREPSTHGGTLRVLYFFDRDRKIICCNGCLKKSDATPSSMIDAAIKIRTAYLADQAAGRITIEDLPRD